MSNRKKRFNNPLEVRLEIIRLKETSRKDIHKAEKAEAELEDVMLDPDISDSGKQVQCNELCKTASQLRRHHSYLLDRKLPMLVRVLSKLQTSKMPFLEDGSALEEKVK
jgi:hypothetical protein